MKVNNSTIKIDQSTSSVKSNNQEKKTNDFNSFLKSSSEKSNEVTSKTKDDSSNKKIDKSETKVCGDDVSKIKVISEDDKALKKADKVIDTIPLDKCKANPLDDEKPEVKKEEDFDIENEIENLNANDLLSVLNQINVILSDNLDKSLDDKNLQTNVSSSLSDDIKTIISDKAEVSKNDLLSYFDNLSTEVKDPSEVLSKLKSLLDNDQATDVMTNKDFQMIQSIVNDLEVKMSSNEPVIKEVSSNILNENMVQNDKKEPFVNLTYASASKPLVKSNNDAKLNEMTKETVSDLSANNTSKDESSLVNDAKEDSTGVQVKDIISDIKKLLEDAKIIKKDPATSNNKSDNPEEIINNTIKSSAKSSNPHNSSDNSQNDSLNTKSDEDILKSIVSDKDTNIINREATFSSKFNDIVHMENVKNVDSISKDNMADDLIKSIKFMQNNNVKELTVKITPENLGELTIKIIEQDGIMKAAIKASSKEGYEILSRNSSIITNEISSQNLKIESVNISLNDDTTFFKGNEFTGQNNHFKSNEGKHNSSSVNNSVEDNVEDDEDILISNINMFA